MTAELPLPVSRRLARMRSALLLGCAFGLVAEAQPARSQAFQGNPTVAAGAINRNAASGSETIEVLTPSAIINWDPFDKNGQGMIDFLPAGNLATFQNGPDNSNFMVLNRILPADASRPVALNGTIVSQLIGGGGETSRGGTVAFYSPGGILIGGSAVIDVGSLLLTTIDPVADQSGNFFVGGQYVLPKAAGPDSFVTIAPGAQVSALAEGSYIAVVAPRILQQGSVKVNGSAAYVAAEGATLTIDQGLFAIEVQAGSGSTANTLVHEGTTGGPAQSGPGDNHRIYMVAVPKNAAITALLKGSAGFEPATSALVENGEIVLSAGRNVGLAGGFAPIAGSAPASFHVTSGTFTSDVRGSAVTDFIAGSSEGGLRVEGDLSLAGGAKAHLIADNKKVEVLGNVLLSADRTPADDPGAGIDVAAGEALAASTGDALLSIQGKMTITASAVGGYDGVASAAGTGTGGTSALIANGGQVEIAGPLEMMADGTGGSGDVAAATGGAGIGGTVRVAATGEGRIGVGGAAALRSRGSGSDIAGSGGTGAAGQGGGVIVSADKGGQVTLGGGGEARSEGKGGSGATGGTGAGGTARVEAANGSVALGPAFLAAATGSGGAASGPAGRGGGGVGGSAEVLAKDEASRTALISGGTLFLDARGTGAAGAGGTDSSPGGRGGDGSGGSARLLAETLSSKLVFASAELQASGFGGQGGSGTATTAGGRGGDSAGGTVEAGTRPNQNGIAGSPGGSVVLGSLAMTALADGGDGGASGTSPGAGGTAAGGQAILFSRGAPVIVSGSASLDASSFGGTGGANGGGGAAGAAGASQGGLVSAGALAQSGSLGLLSAGSLTGAAIGGRWEMIVAGSQANFGSVSLKAGAAGTPATSRIQLENGALTVSNQFAAQSGGDLQVSASGSGRLSAGSVALSAPRGAVAIAHTGRPVHAGTIDAGTFASDSAGAFSNGAGSRIATIQSSTIKAGGDILLTDVRAGDSLAADSSGTIAVDGPATAQTIALASRDIAIGAAGSLGGPGTAQTSLTARAGPAPAVIGGSAGGPGAYTLDRDEVGRIGTAALSVQTPLASNPAAAADLVIRDFAVSGTDGGSGLARLEIAGEGRVRVDGRIGYTQAGAGDILSLTAGSRLQVITPGGGVAVTNGAGAPGGTLRLTAPLISATDAALAAQLAADPGFAGRNAALGLNGGAVQPDGYLKAGGIVFSIRGGLFIQNSGTAAAPAGLTVGQGGLRIVSAAPAPNNVLGFGRRQNADGSFTAGEAFFATIDFSKPGTAYTGDSEFNRCNINSGACPGAAQPPPPGGGPGGPPSGGGPGGPPPPGGDPGPPPPPAPADPAQPAPPRDTLLGPVDGARAPESAGSLVDTSALDEALWIDEPVASGAESSQWEEEEEDEEEEDGDQDQDEDKDGEKAKGDPR